MTQNSTAATILYHQPVVERDTIMGGPSTTKCVLCSQIACEGHHLSPSTKSNYERHHIEQQATYLTHHQRHLKPSTQPPPLLHTKNTPLPALADVPISINPLLSYNPSKVTLEYDLRLPPITAHLLTNTRTLCGKPDWRQQSAMKPSTVGSMTIVVPGLGRAIVVFPATSDSGVVTISDVLVAVYRAVQESSIEQHGAYGAKGGAEERKDFSAWRQADLKEVTTASEELGEDHWWAGLHPYQMEKDIWVLCTRRVDHR